MTGRLSGSDQARDYLRELWHSSKTRTNATNSDALVKAAAVDDAAEVVHLVVAGADVDSPDCDGVRPVLAAARYGQRETVTFLLDRGAKSYALPGETKPLLCLVAVQGWADIAERILDAGVPVDTRNGRGAMALHKQLLSLMR